MTSKIHFVLGAFSVTNIIKLDKGVLHFCIFYFTVSHLSFIYMLMSSW